MYEIKLLLDKDHTPFWGYISGRFVYKVSTNLESKFTTRYSPEEVFEASQEVVDRVQADGGPACLPIPKVRFGNASEVFHTTFTSRSIKSGSRTSYLLHNLVEQTDIVRFGYSVSYSPLAYNLIVMCHEVVGVEGDPLKVSLYRNYGDLVRGRKTEMKIGRAIKWIFPNSKDSDVELVVKKFQNHLAKREYQLKVGEDRASFAHAYSDKLAKSYDPVTSKSRKSLHNSCMRGVEVDGVSPAEVYASGEFKIIWLEDDIGRIAGRVVVWFGDPDGKPQAGPVYGVCESSLDQLGNYLVGIGATLYEDDPTWKGAKLLRIEYLGGLVGPYSDLETSVDDCGDSLTISLSGGCELSRTDGYVGCSHLGCCECCGYETGTDDIEYVDDHGYICSGCLASDFTYLDGRGYVRDEDTTIVYYLNSVGFVHSSVRHIEDDDFVYCDCVGEWWDLDDVTYSEEEDEFVPNHRLEEFAHMFEKEEDKEAVL